MTIPDVDLKTYGWIQRPNNGRWVHPDLPIDGNTQRRRIFTEAEALTLTAAQLQDRCGECGEVHE